MPLEELATVAELGAEVASDKIHRKFGWRGCVVASFAAAIPVAALIYFLTR